jgi:3'(2'), 5'-bisphosphate nucleotidase
MLYKAELETALEAAAQAGRLVLEAYASFTAIPDAPVDISTQADRQAQELILRLLAEAFPTDALCAEEQLALRAGAATQGPRLWVVDPIDGTRGFARKNGEFSIMIGFVAEGRVVVGVVFEPVPGRLTYASRGAGCWRRDSLDQQPTPCRVSSVAELSKATLTRSHLKPGASPKVDLALGTAHVHPTYSAGIKLGRVARGEADVYVNIHEAIHDWDICAGHILVEEAGGSVTALHGQPIQYGSEGAWQRSGLIATNGLLYPAVIARADALGV